MFDSTLSKKIKSPVSYESLHSLIHLLAQNKAKAETSVFARYMDADGESVIIEDDTDLELAYEDALKRDKRIKFIVEGVQQLYEPAPVLARPQVQYKSMENELPTKKNKR